MLFVFVKNTYQKTISYLLISILNTVGTNGFEPSTSRLSGVRSNHLSYAPISIKTYRLVLSSLFPFKPFGFGGDEEDRTPDPLRARQVLSQLSYTPIFSGT